MEAVTFSLGEPGRFIVLLSCFLSFGFSSLFSLVSPLGNSRDISHSPMVQQERLVARLEETGNGQTSANWKQFGLFINTFSSQSVL